MRKVDELDLLVRELNQTLWQIQVLSNIFKAHPEKHPEKALDSLSSTSRVLLDFLAKLGWVRLSEVSDSDREAFWIWHTRKQREITLVPGEVSKVYDLERASVVEAFPSMLVKKSGQKLTESEMKAVTESIKQQLRGHKESPKESLKGSLKHRAEKRAQEKSRRSDDG